MICSAFQSCKKDWLDAKPDRSLVIPNSVKDFQSLLDNTVTVQFNGTQSVALGEIAAGDFYVLNSSWPSIYTNQEKAAYIWAETSDFYSGEPNYDWTNAYAKILNTNVVLSGIEKVKLNSTDQISWNSVKGAALFYRAFEFFNLAQQYCRPYANSTSNSDLGLPLRLDYDVNVPSVRATVQQTYDQVIGDLKKAANLLTTTPLFKTRPSKQAAYALLARTYLSMSAYDQAGIYADSALQIQHELIDYKSLNTGADFPISLFNPEVIFHSSFFYGIFDPSLMIVDKGLYDSYTQNDLRKSVFYTAAPSQGMTFKGSYTGEVYLFGGLATDEMYLIRAEAMARRGNTTLALKDLNDLLRKRFTGDYVDYFTADAGTALIEILKERRKELIFRGLRWFDLRRLNMEERFKTTLTKNINNKTYTLLPNSTKYVFPIDEIEIRLSGIQQNQR